MRSSGSRCARIQRVRGELTNSRIFPARRPNTCRSLVGSDDAIKVGGRYEPKDGRIAATETLVQQPGGSDALRKETQAENLGWENLGWYAGIAAEMFG